jgi:flagellar hook-associated protein FlgK
MADDPIQDVITALTTSNLITSSGGNISAGSMYDTIKPLVQAIFQVSALQSVSSDVKTALTSAASTLTAIGTALQTSGGSLGDIGGVMTGLQNALSSLQSLAPSGAAPVMNTASSLFQTIQGQLNSLAGQAGKTIADAVTELNQLSQILTLVVALFP